ncbi:MAG TPA: hypothetical protein VF530_02815 [Planctomycetota bacterium]
MSIRPLFLVPTLLLSSLGLAQDWRTPASPVTWLDQDRWVDATASAEFAPLSFDHASAPDLGPFEAWVSAGAGGTFAQAFQNSVVEQEGIHAKGRVDSLAFVFGDRAGQSHSGSSLSLRFSVSTRASYHARGALAASGFLGLSGSRVELLQEDGTPIFVREATGPDESVTIDQRGLLEPGEYVLELSAGAGGTGQIWNNSASFDLALDIRAVGRR